MGRQLPERGCPFGRRAMGGIFSGDGERAWIGAGGEQRLAAVGG